MPTGLFRREAHRSQSTICILSRVPDVVADQWRCCTGKGKASDGAVHKGPPKTNRGPLW
jgi:hypothetical protein